jgi:hypothetical protein
MSRVSGSRIQAQLRVLLLAMLAVAWPSMARSQTDSRRLAQTGTAVIRGRVLAADTGRALRRARVAVSSPAIGDQLRAANTNAEGRYEITDLPAGRYTVTASRSAYLTLRLCQSRALEQGKPLQVLDGQIVGNVDFTLPRMSVVAGRITDEAGQPMAGVRVFVLRSSYIGQRRLGAVGDTISDDRGQYRVVNLVPSAYYVLATLRQTWTIIEGGAEQVIGYGPTYYPGTTNASDARRVALGVGEHVINVDFPMIRGRAATVSGTAIDSHGQPLTGQTVYVVQESPGGGGTFTQGGGPMIAADGTFAIKDLAPGEYKLAIRDVTGGAGTTHVEEATTAHVVVNGTDLHDLPLVTSRGGAVTGQVIAAGGGAPSLPPDRIKIAGVPFMQDADLRVGGIDGSGEVKEDWTFFVGGLFGRNRIRTIVPDGWVMKAVLHDGRDITDMPIELKSSERLSDVQVVLTDRVTTVTGRITDDKGGPVSDGTVIVFPGDAEKWADESRYIRTARPDLQGQFQVRGLPAGEYLVVAIDYVQDGTWNDPEYLESLRRYGQTLTLMEGESQVISLKLASP